MMNPQKLLMYWNASLHHYHLQRCCSRTEIHGNSHGFDACLCQDDVKNFGFSSGFHGSLKFMEFFKVSTSVYARVMLKT